MTSINYNNEENMSVQTTLPISSKNCSIKSKSLDTTNYVDDDLNSYSSPIHFKNNGKEYVEVTVPILSDDYNYLYGRFEKCLGDANALMREFLEGNCY